MEPTPSLIRAIAHLFSTAVRTLDKSTSGWWRFIVVLGFVWAFATAYDVTHRVDPQKVFEGMRKPTDDCPVLNGRWNCDQ